MDADPFPATRRVTVDIYPIHHVSFPSQHLLAATFLRFQEHYESPKFAGKAFDWEEFMDWYAADRGAFTYLKDWTAFNIPSRMFAPFREGRFDPLTRKETWLLSLFEGVAEPFYVIGTCDSERDDLAHEIVRGLFAVFPDYGAAVRQCLAGHPLPGIRTALVNMGYGAHVLDDEVNAYLLTGLAKELGGIERRAVHRAGLALHALFGSRFGLNLRQRKHELSLSDRIHHHRYEPR